MFKNSVNDAWGNRPGSRFPVSHSQIPEYSLTGAEAAWKGFGQLRQQGASLACCVLVLFLAMFLPASLSAQGATGTISGHVADSTGAAIPGAAITLTNTATSGVRTTISTGSGDYAFPAVPIGTYVLKAEHQGFKVATSQDLQLQVAQSLTQNFTLQVGGVEQSIMVTSAGDLLQTQNTSLGTTVPNQTLAQMPVNNRNYLNLVAVSANANVISPSQGQAGAREGGARASEAISVGGSRIMFDHYTLDGINNSDADFNSYVVQPSIDAIQEMKVQTGVYPAEYGYNATQINVVSKSGTNHYHGTAFDFVRNNYADARGYWYNYPNKLPPAVLPYKYNDYGFVLGGPITIPHVFNGTNRFFFMVNDEWYSQVQFSNSTLSLPSAAELAGDFSHYKPDKNGNPTPIYDPASGNADGTGRSQFQCNGVLNVICPTRVDPISQKFIQLYYAAAQSSAATSNYTFLNQGSDKHDGFNVRADFNQSQKSQWAFRFSNGLETNPNKGFTTAGGTVGSKIITKYYQYMGSNTWTISPTLVNVASFGWTNFYNSLGLYSQGSDDDVTKLGIPNLKPGPSTTWGIPSVGFTGDLFSGIGDSSDGPYVTTDPDISINDNITWIHGKHSVDMGFQYERQTFNELGNQFSRGNFVFQRDQTAQVPTAGNLASGTGSAFASFLLGDLYSAAYAVQIAQANYKRNVEAAYVDDNFKITPKLSIQAGLRYELTPPWYDTLGTEFIVDMQTNHSPIDPVVSGPEPQQNWPIYMRQGNCNDPYQGVNVRWVQSDKVTPVNPGPQCANGDYPNSLMQTDYVDFAPRIGLSLQATPTLIIRTGFGIYFAHDTANARFDMARNLAGRVTNITGGGAAGVDAMNWNNAVGGGGTALIPPPYSFSMQYDHRTSNSQVWLLDVQKQFGTNWQIEAGYMGSKSSHLFGFRNANYSIPYGLLGAAGYYPAGAKTGTCTASGDPSVVCGGPKSILDRTPYPNYGVIQLVHDVGIANYQALSFQVNKRFSNGFNLISSYTYSKSLDDTSGIRTQSSQLFPQTDLCITCEYGPSDFDVKHRLVASFIYDLPVGPGRLWAPSSKLVNALIGGWELTTLGTLQSGRPYNMRYVDNNASTNTIAGGTYATRPNYVSGQSFLASHPTVGVSGQWVNIAAWQEPANGFLGNTKRNMLYGPGVENFDMSLDKTFNMPYNEHHQFQIRLDAFNALNHTDFGTPDTNLTSGTKGQITGSALGARELQLGARYTF